LTQVLLEKVLSSQAPSGAFYATVMHLGKQFQDENGFVTCLILRELAKISRNREVDVAIEKGLDFLGRCANHQQPNAFHFYPPDQKPNGLAWGKVPRADDTALFTMALVKHGYMTYEEGNRVVDEVLDPHRLENLPESISPWIHQGSYKTWLDANRCPNRVDCCVNANIAALLKMMGREDHSGYQAAVATVVDGVRHAVRSPSMTTFLSPYHPDPCEMVHAMARAAEMGVVEFEKPLLHLAQSRLKPMRRRSGLKPICGSGDGKTLWFSHTLQVARNMTRFNGMPMATSA